MALSRPIKYLFDEIVAPPSNAESKGKGTDNMSAILIYFDPSITFPDEVD